MKTTYVSTTAALFAAVIAVVLFALPSRSDAQGILVTITPYDAIIPTDPANYENYVAGMVQAMEQGSSSESVAFLTPGSTIPATQAFTYYDGTGNELDSGAVIVSSSTFTLNQVSYTFTSPAWSFDGTLSGWSFGPACIGILFGPDGPGSGDTVYKSGDADTTPVNEIVVDGNAYSFQVNYGDTTANALQAFKTLDGSQLPITAEYILNGQNGSETVTLATPEPTILALAGCGLFGLLLLRNKSR